MNISDLPTPEAWFSGTRISEIGRQFMAAVRFAVLWLWNSGTTAQRPVNPVLGQAFWDTTLGTTVICSNPGSPTTGTPATWSLPFTTTNPINTQTVNYTLALTDAGGCVEMNLAGANTLTIPTNASVNFPVGTIIMVRQEGAGITTIAAAGGVTLHSPRTLAFANQYGTASLHQRAVNDWRADGDLT